MKLRSAGVLVFVLLGWTAVGEAQTKVKLSSVTTGTECVQLVYNGDFQFQGPLVTNVHPFPGGWVAQAEMLADGGTNLVLANHGVVARASASGGAPVSMYSRTVRLEPNADYVLSAYVWNMGDAANHVNSVVDLSDAPQEPQLTLYWSDANADQGYFLYRSFNTRNTGSNVTLRVFYDGLTGAGAAAGYFPLAAQWDNIAITKAASFLLAQSSGSGGNLRPTVSITNPTDGAYLFGGGNPATVSVGALASDDDGTIAKVEFYSGTTKLGETASQPYALLWTNGTSGPYPLTAVATDNQGATTVSAPVAVWVMVAPALPTLQIARAGSSFSLGWPTSATAFSLESASEVGSGAVWRAVTNAAVVSTNQKVVTVPNGGRQELFRLGTVDASTLEGKLLMGYQGWFGCPGDGSAGSAWVHWFRHNAPVATNATVDFWPDISELEPDELFATDMTLTNGSPASVYSAFNPKTVMRHFKWMKDYNLEGVFLQRFSSALSSASSFAFRNQVTVNVRLGAEAYGRVFAIMYDISGTPGGTLVSTLTNDWGYLANALEITKSPSYLRHRGQPVVAIWGFGFTDRPGTPDDALTVINWFKSAGLTVLGGVPTYWRTLKNDSQTNAAWATVYRSYDIISPWSVGRFSTLAGADTFKQNLIVTDLVQTASLHLDYMPVIFPGFSWHNLKGDAYALNQIPRNGGTFYWHQMYNAISAGCTMLYGAMFDEMDEGTAMLKLAARTNDLPVEGSFVPLNTDGNTNLPSDWYLRLAEEASRMLRGDIPLQDQVPITP